MLQSRSSLPDAAKQLSADAFFTGVTTGHNTARRGQNVDSETALYAGDVFLANVHPATRARLALEVLNNRLTFGSVLEIDFDDALHALFGNLEVGNVALFFEDACDFR